MKFLRYAAIVPFVFLLSNLAQAVPVASVKETVIKPGNVLTVNYVFNAKTNAGLRCTRSGYSGNYDDVATWMNKGVQKSHELPLHLSANPEFIKQSGYGWGWANAQGTVTIENNSNQAKDLIVTCEYVAMPVAKPTPTPVSPSNPGEDNQPAVGPN